MYMSILWDIKKPDWYSQYQSGNKAGNLKRLGTITFHSSMQKNFFKACSKVSLILPIFDQDSYIHYGKNLFL